jgi:hypothetical protein
MNRILIAIVLLFGCATHDLTEEAPPATERAVPEGEAALEPALGVAPEAICPVLSTPVCNPSGRCRCCWPVTPEVCCRLEEPYIRCNASGRCRCSTIP